MIIICKFAANRVQFQRKLIVKSLFVGYLAVKAYGFRFSNFFNSSNF